MMWRQAYLILANGLRLLIDVLVEQLHSLLQAQVMPLGMQNIHFQPSQFILKLNHQHLLIIHCNTVQVSEHVHLHMRAACVMGRCRRQSTCT